MSPTRPAQEAAALEQLARGRASLVIERPFIGVLALQLHLQPVWDSRVPTAATDGHVLWFRPDWMLEQSESDRRFVLAHEVWHCALAHFARTTPGDHEIWNIAFDHEVNALLVRDGLSLPAGAVLFDAWMGLNAEQVFNRLEQRDGNRPERGPDADGHIATMDQTKGVEVDPRFQPTRRSAAATQSQWRVRIAGALQQAARHGLSPSSHALDVLRGLLQPAVAWQALLEQHLRRVHGGSATWLPPNRRAIHRGLYLPGRRESVLRAVVAIDTSGSTGQYLGAFVDELAALLGTFARYDITVLGCDTQLQAPQRFSPHEPLSIDALQLRGGGGTDLRPPFEWVAKREPPNVLVYLTDGGGPTPEQSPGFPVLWVLTPDGHPPADWGAVSRMTTQESYGYFRQSPQG